MSSDREQQAEQEVLSLVQKVLDENAPMLCSIAVVPEVQEIRRSAGVDTYDSEVAIYFWRGGELVDVAEFDVFRGGLRAATQEETAQWLRYTIGDVIARHGARVRFDQ